MRVSEIYKIKKLLGILIPISIFILSFTFSQTLSRTIAGSPYDEVGHADMIYQTFERHAIPPSGSKLNDWTIAQAGCRGFIPPFPNLQECTIGPYDPNALSADGLNTASGYPPVFYVVSAAQVWLLTKFDFKLDWNLLRLSTSLLFAYGATVTYLFFKKITNQTGMAAFFTIWISSIPIVLFQGSTINPESMSLLAGSTLGYLAMYSKLSLRNSLGFGLISSAVMLIKPTFIFAVLPAVFIYFVRTIRSKDSSFSTFSKAKNLSLSSLTFIFINIFWEIYRLKNELPIMGTLNSNETFGQLASKTSYAKRLAITLRTYLGYLGDTTQKPNIDDTLGFQVAAISGLLAICTVLVIGLKNLLNKDFSDIEKLLSSATFFGLVLGSATLVFVTEKLTNIFFVTGRYALPITSVATAAFIAFMMQVRQKTLALILIAFVLAIQISYLPLTQKIIHILF